MTHQYTITGLTCAGCVAKAKSAFLKLGAVTEAAVQLEAPQATITMQQHIPLPTLQSALDAAGAYTITEADGGMHAHREGEETLTWLATYKPVLLIGLFITGITVITASGGQGFDWASWMQQFMAAFFLAFSFFKLLDVKGFAESYATYDVIAKRWFGWGLLYPFI
ncbi:MAG TPA: heavy metal-associated domain-containing protein, partial [Chitinophagaceae bacterium]|nr:heavy metal-associated domain-containing protein [Chitinophagaceae bacterium]